MNMLLLAENIMIKDWGTISANTIEALKIMGMGILAIFIVIAIIMIAVYILNAIDNKSKNKSTAPVADAKTEVATTPTPMVETSTNVAPVESAPVVEEEEPMLRSELGESKYRKTGDVDAPSKYRKNNDD